MPSDFELLDLRALLKGLSFIGKCQHLFSLLLDNVIHSNCSKMSTCNHRALLKILFILNAKLKEARTCSAHVGFGGFFGVFFFIFSYQLLRQEAERICKEALSRYVQSWFTSFGSSLNQKVQYKQVITLQGPCTEIICKIQLLVCFQSECLIFTSVEMSDKIPTDFTDIGSGHAAERISATTWQL